MAIFSKFMRKAKHLLPFLGDAKPVVAVLELHGAIGVSSPGARNLNYSRIRAAIDAAFKLDGVSAVALAINSPGGSPVQSRLIHDAVRRGAAKNGTPVYAFIEDVGASGGYILALAGDEIYADESSIVGSIGVISASFGFEEAIAKLGVERRVYTAGDNKSQLDPFRAEAPEDVARLETILDDLHQQFIAMVKTRRGDALKPTDETFSGAFWTASDAQKQGLIDGTAQLDAFLQDKFGDDVKLKRMSLARGSLLRRLLGGEERASAGRIDPETLLAAADARALWARYGK
ncbi:MAG: S49 family peptidase [Pseudomonadota bacterium]